MRLALSAGIGGFLFGYDTGIISGALFYIRDDFQFVEEKTWLQETIVSMAVAGAVFGAAFCGYINDRFGRKKSVLAADVVFFVGALVQAAAPAPWVIIVGRFLVGLGVGMASMTSPLYISECSPARIRGALVSTNGLLITSGQFLSYLINLAFTQARGTWRWMVGVACLPALIQFCLMWSLPESPRWLYRQNKIDEARAILEKIYPSDEVEKEMSALAKSTEAEKADEAVIDENLISKLKGAFKNTVVRRGLYAGITVQVAQQFVAFDASKWNCMSCLNVDCGFCSNPASTFLPGACVAATKDLKSACKAEHGVFFEQGCPSRFGFLAVILLALYIIVYAPGMGTVPWIVNSEIYPLRYRGLGGGIAAVSNWSSNLIVSESYLTLTENLGAGGTFFVFAVISCISLCFIYRFVPETKGLKFEEVEKILEEGYKPSLCGGKTKQKSGVKGGVDSV
ncbi:sugar transporter, putative [Ricinus communis]|uniref:Sugar transporter, putative n=1 Tax=Ricinus communis TaxID=3988 RepID=B9SP34_RICCO|nr:sugar transporter, putative [Ricinus communis]